MDNGAGTKVEAPSPCLDFGARGGYLPVVNPIAKIFLVLLAFLALPMAGFAQNVPAPNAVYGAYPAKYQEIIMTWLNSSLADPRSVKVNWLGEPKPGELNIKGQVISGFLVDFSVNARNIFGAYTGPQKHTALIRDGKVVTATGFVFH